MIEFFKEQEEKARDRMHYARMLWKLAKLDTDMAKRGICAPHIQKLLDEEAKDYTPSVA